MVPTNFSNATTLPNVTKEAEREDMFAALRCIDKFTRLVDVDQIVLNMINTAEKTIKHPEDEYSPSKTLEFTHTLGGDHIFKIDFWYYEHIKRPGHPHVCMYVSLYAPDPDDADEGYYPIDLTINGDELSLPNNLVLMKLFAWGIETFVEPYEYKMNTDPLAWIREFL